MKKMYIYIIFTLFLFSCEDSYVKEGRKTYNKYFQEVLNDPKSLDVLSEKHEQINKSVYWIIDYTAKNKIGGNIRTTDYFLTIKDYLKRFESKEEYAKSLSEAKTTTEDEKIISVKVENITDSIKTQ